MKKDSTNFSLPEVLSPVDREVFSEKKKPEWSVGFVTAHRISVVCFIFISVFLVHFGASHLWKNGQIARSLVEQVWATGHTLWLAGVPACFLGLLGLVLYRRQDLKEVKVIEKTVAWRIVSRGRNVSALVQTIDTIHNQMKTTPLFPYVIEVVTEEGEPFSEVALGPQVKAVHLITVPADYQTSGGTKFKARALHYAMEHSTLPDDSWIVHLDEESHPTESSVLGIAKMIGEEEQSGRLRIGQGAILYHRLWKEHRFWTLLDSARTGQDFGPFFLQTRLGISLYGFHGSYIVIRNDVEKSIDGGFDLGPKGEITEDAWWVLMAHTAGHKIRWVEGFIEEQSVQSWSDFVKQRGRWFNGLLKVIRHAPVAWWRRVPLGLNLLLWMVVWVSVPYSFAHAVYGFDTQSVILEVAMISWLTYALMAIVGLWANLIARKVSLITLLVTTVIQFLLVPLFCLMEMWAACWKGVLNPEVGFFVIKK